MSDALTAGMPDTYYSKFRGLQISIYTTLFAAVLGGGGFLVASIFLAYDKKKVDDYLAGKSKLVFFPASYLKKFFNFLKYEKTF